MTNLRSNALHAQTTQPRMIVRVPQHVVYRAFVSETVVLNLQTGKYHGLNPTAGRMMEALDRLRDPEDAVALLAEEFDVPADTLRQDLHEFCESMASRGLLEIASRGAR
jgi:Coenzyme PQQ synthesis protein D (PqqD)